MYKFLKDLNPQQLKAAKSLSGPVLILAGAGSGKTKTIVARTANIIASDKALPHEILIMTFTNKAAREMKERGTDLLMKSGYWKGYPPEFTTFHAFGVKFLKTVNHNILKTKRLYKNFSIADDSDQLIILNKLVKKYLEDFEIKPKDLMLPLTNLQNRMISYNNYNQTINELNEINESFFFQFFQTCSNVFIESLAQVYVDYKNELRNNNMIDFDDLINIPIQLLQENEELKMQMKFKYKFIMVDEFQDTNYSQLTLLDLLLNKDQNLCVVGDNDQSIYGWRGANIQYILNFHKKYENCVDVNLKTNYRSTDSIVKTANKLLTHSKQKHNKKESLEAFNKEKGIVTAGFFDTKEEESEAISKKIRSLMLKDNPGDIAILYRAGFINRVLEINLIKYHIPYKIHNGKALLDKKVSQDIIAYLKYFTNKENSLSLGKVLIGAKILSDKKMGEIQIESENHGESIREYISECNLTKSVREKVDLFLEEIAYFEEMIKRKTFKDFCKDFFTKNCIRQEHQRIINKRMSGDSVAESSLEKAQSNIRILNLVEEVLKGFSSIESFLETAALEGEESDKETNKVNLMTVHASKGLEFKHVFVAGFAQGIFPMEAALREVNGIEEERRLAYVALTRAEYGLFVTGAPDYYGRGRPLAPSQFFKEANLILKSKK